jgi:hypothetical protein
MRNGAWGKLIGYSSKCNDRSKVVSAIAAQEAANELGLRGDVEGPIDIANLAGDRMVQQSFVI